jgi:regulator of sigma E protease
MLDLLWNVGSFIVAIGVLVAFHEFGHFVVARRCGVKVLRFSVGFGRPIWGRRARDGVEWVISAVPLGGYVKMLDEREGPVLPHERARAFNNAPVWRRILIVVAGPAFNFVLAVLFYWIVFVVGVAGEKPLLAQPSPNSAAARAGLAEGELVLAISGETVPTWNVLRTELIDRVLGGGHVGLTVQAKDGARREVDVDLGSVRVDPDFLFDDLGLEPYAPPLKPVLGDIQSGSAAAAAGLRPGDRVLAINALPVTDYQGLVKWVRAHPGEVAHIDIERAGVRSTVNAIIASEKDGGHLGAGVAEQKELWQDLRAENRLGPIEAVPAAFDQTWRMSVLTLKMLWRMVLGEVSVKNVSGPIQIAQVAGYSAQIGLVSFLSFMAVVSVSLGVLNLLPVPLLDGGHLLYYGIEAVKGAPLSDAAQEAGQKIGLTFLVLLMGLAFYNDIMRLLN